MLVEIVRFIVVIAFMAGSYQFARSGSPLVPNLGRPQSGVFVVTLLGTAIGYIVGGLVARFVDITMTSAERRLARRHASEVLAATLGLLIGLLLGTLVAMPVVIVVQRPLVSYPIAGLVVVIAGTFGLRFAVRKRLELFGVMGVAPAPSGPDGGCLLDTSAAIDGRVVALWRAGLLPQPLSVPSFILWELQGIADSGDPIRRRRGQRGLEVLRSLREAGGQVRVIDEDPVATIEPDAKLLIIARRHGLPVVTSDSNLAQAAELQGLKVLSLHALADLLRPPVSPGERVNVQLVKEGREPGQAVGYLDDGTMVVVERARSRLGQEADVEVTSVLQTTSGRMLFARLADGEQVLKEAT